MTSQRTEKWDHRFLDMAEMVSTWSKDPRKKCGAVIVRPDRSVVSVGFNGFPRWVPDLEEHLMNREEKLERIIHAEVNAILSTREPLKGYTLYTFPRGYGPSCSRCTTCIIQVGISRVVHYGPLDADHKSNWLESDLRGLDMYKLAGVEVTTYE